MHEFRLPGAMYFGWGALEQVGPEAARLGKRALLVTGRGSMKRLGVEDRVVKLLADAGVDVVPFSGVESDPRSATVDRGGRAARGERCDLGCPSSISPPPPAPRARSPPSPWCSMKSASSRWG
jgi:alcohol dehydrogenase YqhD (iron-dependent ADH family)